MTELDNLVHTLPMDSKMVLMWVYSNPTIEVPAIVETRLSRLLNQGLVNVRDGHMSVSQRGAAVVRALDTERKIAAGDRFLNIMAGLIACEGEVKGLEQAFSSPNFTEGEREMFTVCLQRALEAIEKADQ